MLKIYCLFIYISLCHAFQLQVCTNMKPNTYCVRTVADTFKILREHNIETVNVNVEKRYDNINVVADILCKGGFRTSAIGKGNSMKDACESSCRKAIKTVKKKKKNKFPSNTDQCYLIHDLRI